MTQSSVNYSEPLKKKFRVRLTLIPAPPNPENMAISRSTKAHASLILTCQLLRRSISSGSHAEHLTNERFEHAIFPRLTSAIYLSPYPHQIWLRLHNLTPIGLAGKLHGNHHIPIEFATTSALSDASDIFSQAAGCSSATRSAGHTFSQERSA